MCLIFRNMLQRTLFLTCFLLFIERSYTLTCYNSMSNSTVKPSDSSLNSCAGNYCYKIRVGDYVQRGCSYNFTVLNALCQSWGNNCKSCVNMTIPFFNTNINSNDCTLCCCEKDGCNFAVSMEISFIFTIISMAFVSFFTF